jgi:hypothetical protein
LSCESSRDFLVFFGKNPFAFRDKFQGKAFEGIEQTNEKKRMNRASPVAEVAKVMESKRKAEEAVFCLFNTITKALKKGLANGKRWEFDGIVS